MLQASTASEIDGAFETIARQIALRRFCFDIADALVPRLGDNGLASAATPWTGSPTTGPRG
jgi:hypothetical protein